MPDTGIVYTDMEFFERWDPHLSTVLAVGCARGAQPYITQALFSWLCMRALITRWLFHLGSVKWTPVIIASFFRALSAWHLIDWAWGAHFPFLWLSSFFLRGTLRTIDFPCTLSFPLSSSQAPLAPRTHPPFPCPCFHHWFHFCVSLISGFEVCVSQISHTRLQKEVN